MVTHVVSQVAQSQIHVFLLQHILLDGVITNNLGEILGMAFVFA